ncbi:hypothetical protein FJZ33_06310 [Candidatus Poribacteria bacterium]|nr:hypothetical protein [Candidatus Poribacteria bacterium]
MKGNILYNASFELGTSGWATYPQYMNTHLDTSETYHGKYSLRLEPKINPDVLKRPWKKTDNEGWKWYPIETIFYPVKASFPYTFSFWAKSNKDNTKLRFNIFSGYQKGWHPGDYNTDRPGILMQTRNIDTQWKRFSVFFIPNNHPGKALTIRFVLPEEGKIWLDGLQLEEGYLSPFSVKQPLELTIQVGKNERFMDFIYTENESISITTKLFTENVTKREIDINYYVYDYFHNIVKDVNRKTLIDDSSYLSDKIELQNLDFGLYKIVVKAVDGKDTYKAMQASFVVVPEKLNKMEEVFTGNDIWYFGLLPEERKLGVGWLLAQQGLGLTEWENVEPQKGKWVFDDELMSWCEENKMMIVGNLAMHAPNWARIPKEEFSYGFRMDEYLEYVRKTVSHFRGRIKHWEVLNEPYWAAMNSDWTLIPNAEKVAKDYAEILKSTYELIKAIDSENKVLGLSTYPEGVPLKWTEDVLKVYGTKYFDILSYHGYMNGRMPDEGRVTQTHRLNSLRLLMEKYGMVKPMWDTELSCRGGSFFDDITKGYAGDPVWTDADWTDGRAAARWLTSIYLTGLANGVERFAYFNGIEPSWSAQCIFGKESFFEYTGSPRPIAVANATMARFLTGMKFWEQVIIGRNIRCYIFKNDEHLLVVLWGIGMKNNSKQLQLNILNEKLEIFSIVGSRIHASVSNGKTAIPLSADPIYVVAKDISNQKLYNIFLRGQIR